MFIMNREGIKCYCEENIYPKRRRVRWVHNHDTNPLKNHYILCGAGRTGQSIINEFKRNEVQFVVIEIQKEKIENLKKQGILALHGDATSKVTLSDACIDECKGLFAFYPMIPIICL